MHFSNSFLHFHPFYNHITTLYRGEGERVHRQNEHGVPTLLAGIVDLLGCLKSASSVKLIFTTQTVVFCYKDEYGSASTASSTIFSSLVNSYLHQFLDMCFGAHYSKVLSVSLI